MKGFSVLLAVWLAATTAAAETITVVDDTGRLTPAQAGRLGDQAAREYGKLKVLFKADAGPVTLRVRAAGVARHLPPATIHVPIRLVQKGTAITAHELAHLLTQGWASPLLKEGLAVYAQDLIGEQRGWPNYRRTVHGAARHWTSRPDAPITGPGEADKALAQPRKGQARLRQAAYAVAGSWVKWIIEAKMNGDLDRFMAELYRTNAYKAATGRRYPALAREWRRFIAGR